MFGSVRGPLRRIGFIPRNGLHRLEELGVLPYLDTTEKNEISCRQLVRFDLVGLHSITVRSIASAL